jgi:phosphoribosylamine--glycine ligase
MKILVVGSGGREHAFVWKLAHSRYVTKIFCAPGNGGISRQAECVPIKADDIQALLDFAKKERIDLTVVGPEAPLVAGIVDEFSKSGLKVFGPSKRAAELEASKNFAKELMKKNGVPTAGFVTCHSVEEVFAATDRLGLPIVVKADGLAAGKGVIICETKESVEQAAKSILVDRLFGDSGNSVVVEEYLEGEEASVLVLTDGEQAIPLASSQDHKRVFDGDRGPNTGGMGAYSPAPVVTAEILESVMQKIIYPVLGGMKAIGAPYKGILYAGIMVTSQGPKVLEFNVRFGDPETQAVLARLDSDLVEAMLWTLSDDREPPKLKWTSRPSVCVVMVSGGYPGNYETGKLITGLPAVGQFKDVVVFHAATKMTDNVYLTDGGRVLGVTALGQDLKMAIDRAYEAIGLINFDEMHFRRDIGWRALKRLESVS